MRINPVLPSYITYHRVCDNSDTTGATCGTKTACHSSVTYIPRLIKSLNDKMSFNTHGYIGVTMVTLVIMSIIVGDIPIVVVYVFNEMLMRFVFF
jgi:hypothetical protein